MDRSSQTQSSPYEEAVENNGRSGQHLSDELKEYDDSFRRHYKIRFSSEPLEYESYFAPAYRFGYELSAHNRRLEWEEVEDQAHAQWAADNHALSWASAEEAIRYAWEEERSDH